jgi:rhomboid protease GluP
MTTAQDFQPTAARWDAFALAAAVPLGSFVHAHLAPKFPPASLNAALGSYLQLRDDELLVALIDSGGAKPIGCAALTTRRVYWIEKTDRAEHPSATQSRPSNRTHTHQLVVRVADYAVLPERAGVIATADGSSGIDLGNGTVIVLGTDDGALAAAVARYLETMGNAARAGAVPEGVVDEDLASRAARALPDVARVTAKGRAFGQELSQFRSALQSATPHAPMTPILIGACVLAYVAMVVDGVPWLTPSADQLSRWGANRGTRVVIDHEYWRLITNVFLHGGLIHLAMNMWSLLVIGPLIERLYGSLAFAVIYLASGIGGAAASLTADPRRTGVGASGAICGILGALTAFLIVHRRAIPKSILKSFRGSLISVVVFMAVLGLIVPNIDQQAHVGGLVTGFLSAALLSRPWPVISSRRVTLRRLIAGVLIGGALACVVLAVVRRASAALPANVRLQAIQEEYQSIAGAAPNTLILCTDFDNQKARAGHLKKIRALTGRALANLAALRRVTTSDARFRSHANALTEAQASQLAGLEVGARFLETGDPEVLPPAIRFQAIMDRIGPALEVYNSVTNAVPSTLLLRKDIDDPRARAAHLESTRALIGRALANLTTVQRVTTPDPLLKNMLKSLALAQSGQLASLRAAERFLETGDPKNLNGEGGMLDATAIAQKAVRAFQEQQTSFLRANKLIREDAGS